MMYYEVDILHTQPRLKLDPGKVVASLKIIRSKLSNFLLMYPGSVRHHGNTDELRRAAAAIEIAEVSVPTCRARGH